MNKSLRICIVFVSIALVLFSSLASAEKAAAPAGQSNASQKIPLINATKSTSNLSNIIGQLQNTTMQLNSVTKQLENATKLENGTKLQNATMSPANITRLQNATMQLQGATKQVQIATNPFAKVKGKAPPPETP
jgi:hypothetical protein